VPQHAFGVAHRAQHHRAHHCVKLLAAAELLDRLADHLDRNRRSGSGGPGALGHMRFWFDGNHLLDRLGVQSKVSSDARSDFQHPAGQAGQILPA